MQNSHPDLWYNVDGIRQIVCHHIDPNDTAGEDGQWYPAINERRAGVGTYSPYTKGSEAWRTAANALLFQLSRDKWVTGTKNPALRALRANVTGKISADNPAIAGITADDLTDNS